MKISDYISKIIQEYPSLYKYKNYEESKLRVLDHVFFTIGNGLEMAETEDKAKGGYIVEPKFKRIKGEDEHIRIKDKPYGKEKYRPIQEEYFKYDIYHVSCINRPKDVVFIEYYNFKDAYFLFEQTSKKESFGSSIVDEILNGVPKLRKIENNHEFSPYPFSKGFSIACDIYYKNLFLQKDWMDELIILCKRTVSKFIEDRL